MIKQQELRIDNWVFDSKTKTIVSVDGLQFTGRIVTTDDIYDDGKRGIEPEGIPLTPEILEKLKQDIHFADEFFIRINAGGILIGQRMKGIKYLRNIKYVHQLQNLFFALTGEELEIKL